MVTDTPVDGNDEALKDAQVCVDIGNAMLRARERDPVAAAVGLVSLAAVLVDGDAAGRTAVAKAMLEAAQQLDPQLLAAVWQ